MRYGVTYLKTYKVQTLCTCHGHHYVKEHDSWALEAYQGQGV
jgi:hypothetical protein